MRISEALSVTYNQLNFSNFTNFVVVKDVRILKRRKEPIRKDFPLPKKGVLKPLTDIFLEYVNRKEGAYLKTDKKVFDISRRHAWNVINKMTGKWCHYYRSQRISHLINDRGIRGVAVAKMLGIKQSSTIDHYDKSEWENHKEKFIE